MRRLVLLLLAVAVVLVLVAVVVFLMWLGATAPPKALLFPLGDVGNATEAVAPLYVVVNGSARYITIAAFGNVTLTTNTTGWYVFTAKYGNIAPIVATGRLPAKGWRITATLSDGSTLWVYNFNDTHGAVARFRGSAAYVWASKIVKVGRFYIWCPVVPDNALRDFILSIESYYIYLFVPRRDYFTFDTRYVYVYVDWIDGYGNWWTKSGWFVYPFSSLTQLSPGSNYETNGLEQADEVYVYWPVIAVYYAPKVTRSYDTYLHVEAR
jgi:hypothetical protein